MKVFVLLGVVLAAALPVGQGKGQGRPQPRACTHFDIKGTLQSFSATKFALKPTRKKDGTEALTIALTPTTSVFWTSRGTLAGPSVGERAWAKGKRCGTAYTATWVLVSAPQ